jgi:hypothetical protein
MKNYTLLSTLLFLAITLTSCEVIGGIFKAGVWVGIIVVVLVIAIIGWIFSKLR